MRGNKIMGILWIIIALFLGFILIFSLKGNKGSKSDFIKIETAAKDFGTVYKTLTFNPSEINDLDIELTSESLYMEESNSDIIEIDLYCSADTEPKVTTYQNSLKITSAKVHLITLNFNRKVVIKLPKTMNLANADIDCASGSVHIKNVSFPTMDCKSSSGSVHIENCKIDVLDAKSSSGSVNIKDSIVAQLDCSAQSGSVNLEGSFDKIEARSISGSVNAELSTPLLSDSEFHSTSGSVRLKVPENSNFKVTYSSTSGSYKNAITGTTGKRGSETVGNGGPNVEIKSTSGSIRIN